MRLLFCLFLLTVNQFAYCQSDTSNLVRNGDFESAELRQGVSCPSDWLVSDVLGTTDYFDFENPDTTRIPNRLYQSGSARNGKACMGFIPISPDYPMEMEHLAARLKSPLLQDSIYYIEFYLKLVTQASEFATNNVGVLITDKISFTEYSFGKCYTNDSNRNIEPLLEATVTSYPDFICSDSSWSKVSGYFKASGTESVLIIGSFWVDDIAEEYLAYQTNKKPKSRRQLIKKGRSTMFLRNYRFSSPNVWPDHIRLSYYFIDDVWLSLASAQRQ